MFFFFKLNSWVIMFKVWANVFTIIETLSRALHNRQMLARVLAYIYIKLILPGVGMRDEGRKEKFFTFCSVQCKYACLRESRKYHVEINLNILLGCCKKVGGGEGRMSPINHRPKLKAFFSLSPFYWPGKKNCAGGFPSLSSSSAGSRSNSVIIFHLKQMYCGESFSIRVRLLNEIRMYGNINIVLEVTQNFTVFIQNYIVNSNFITNSNPDF